MANLIVVTSDFDGLTARTQGAGIAVTGIREVGPCLTREGVIGLGCARLFPEEDEVEERTEEEVDDLFDVVAGQW